MLSCISTGETLNLIDAAVQLDIMCTMIYFTEVGTYKIKSKQYERRLN